MYFSSAAPASLPQASTPTTAPSPKISKASSTVSNAPATSTAVVTIPAYVRTLTSEQAQQVLQAFENYSKSKAGNRCIQLHMFQACLIEIGTCLHPNVFLSPLVGPFTALIAQLLMRLEAQICAAFPHIASPSFPNREAMLKAISTASSSSASASTSTAIASTVLSVEEIVVLLCDIKVISLWMQNQLHTNISLSFQAGYSGFKLLRDVDISSEISSNSLRTLASQCRKYQLISDAVWSRALALLSSECKVALQQVKSVAGKYRMTNKPPPDSASPFVVVILKPIKYVSLFVLLLSDTR